MKYMRALLQMEFLFSLYVWAVVFFMLGMIVPMYESVFNEFGGELPAPVRFVLQMSHFILAWWPIVAPVGISALTGLHLWRLRQKTVEDGQTSFVLDRFIPTSIITLGIFAFVFVVWTLKMPSFCLCEQINK